MNEQHESPAAPDASNDETRVAKLKRLIVAIVGLAQVVQELEEIGPEPDGEEPLARRRVLLDRLDIFVRRICVDGITLGIDAIQCLRRRVAGLGHNIEAQNAVRAN